LGWRRGKKGWIKPKQLMPSMSHQRQPTKTERLFRPVAT
jgi:hypothetical protein